MLLAVDSSTLISRILFQHSDEVHVDSCEWEHDPQAGTVTAIFIAERFAKLLITKNISECSGQISEDDIIFMSTYASEELGRQLDELGSMSLFNLSTDTQSQDLPEGMSFRIVYEDENTSLAQTDVTSWQTSAAG